MSHIRIVEGEPAAYSLWQLRQDNPQVSFPDEPSAECLAAFDVFPLAPMAPPEGSLITRVVVAEPVEIEGVWTQQWAIEPLPLEEAKSVMSAAIDARRDQCFQAGFTPATGPLAGKTLQTRNVDDRTNWLTSQAAYSAAVAAGAGAVEDAAFRTADNETIVLSYADGLGVLLAMAAWGKAVMGNSWALKDAVEASEDSAALDLIDIEAGWP